MTERPNRKWRKQARKVIRILRKMIRDAEDHNMKCSTIHDLWQQETKRDGGEQ